MRIYDLRFTLNEFSSDSGAFLQAIEDNSQESLRIESGRAQPHSKALARESTRFAVPAGPGARLCAAALNRLFIAVSTSLLFTSVSTLKTAAAAKTVVVYCAQDQVYAEEIFKDLEKETGTKIKPVFDSEAVKTVGIANRLLAERTHPQCDIFWGNEEMRTRQLAAQNIFRETNGWAAFGYRSRRIAINTNKVSLASAPKSLLDLTNQNWHGKVVFAFPQFGTTATHFHALRQLWGETKWETWCRALAANKPFIVDGNSVVAQMVGSGEAWIGLTDSDDLAAEQRERRPIVPLPMNEETLLIPNTVAIVRGSRHQDTAQRLFEYLQRPETAKRLVAMNALEGDSIASVSTSTLKVNWDLLLRDLDATTAKLNQIFLR